MKVNRAITPPMTEYRPKSDAPNAWSTYLDVNKPIIAVIARRRYTIMVFLAIRMLFVSADMFNE